MVVGAHAVAAHGYLRATGDLDIWISPGGDNAARVLTALERFGAPLSDLTLEDLEASGTVFQIGVVPSRIDLMTAIHTGRPKDLADLAALEAQAAE